MNIQEMLSKMNSQMLMQGLKQISHGLSAEQLKQAESIIKSSGAAKNLGNINIENFQSELSKNPEALKNLVQNRELMAKLEQIVKNK